MVVYEKKVHNAIIIDIRYPGNDIDVFLEPLIDDLQLLFDVGVETYDAYAQEKFTLRAVVLCTINDYPALGILCGCPYSGYQGCVICRKHTKSVRLPYSAKQSYIGHRRYLPYNHPFRKQKKAFNGKQEFVTSLEPMTGEEIYEEVKSILNKWGKGHMGNQSEFSQTSTLTGRGGKIKRKRKSSKEFGMSCEVNKETPYWKKCNIWYQRLSYWRYNSIQNCIDFMHIEKNVCESLVGTLLHVPEKTKDGLQARMDLKHFGLRPGLVPETLQDNGTMLPAACYTLTKEEKDKLCETLSELKVPQGYCSNFSSLVSVKERKLIGLKSHDYHMLMQQFLPIAIRSIMPKPTRYAIIRCMKVIKGHVQNKNKPEGCIAEEYVAEETLEYLSEFQKSMKTIGIPHENDEEYFLAEGKPLSAGNPIEVCPELLMKAHFYVMQNTPKIEPYIERHMVFLKKQHCGQRKEVEKKMAVSKESISEMLMWVSHGPHINVMKYDVYHINGYLFRTKSREGKVNQNSGVSVHATDMHISGERVTYD